MNKIKIFKKNSLIIFVGVVFLSMAGNVYSDSVLDISGSVDFGADLRAVSVGDKAVNRLYDGGVSNVDLTANIGGACYQPSCRNTGVSSNLNSGVFGGLVGGATGYKSNKPVSSENLGSLQAGLGLKIGSSEIGLDTQAKLSGLVAAVGNGEDVKAEVSQKAGGLISNRLDHVGSGCQINCGGGGLSSTVSAFEKIRSTVRASGWDSNKPVSASTAGTVQVQLLSNLKKKEN